MTIEFLRYNLIYSHVYLLYIDCYQYYFQGVVTRKLIIDNFSISQAAELDLNRPENVEAQNSFDVIKQLLNKAELDGQKEQLFKQKLNGVKLR